MVVPAANAYIDPVLAVLGDGEPHSIADLKREAAERLRLSPDDLRDLVPSGKKTRHSDRVHSAVIRLVRAGLAERPQRGTIRITSRGRKVLARADRPIGLMAPKQSGEVRLFKDKRSRTGKITVPSTPDTAATPVSPADQAAAAAARERWYRRTITPPEKRKPIIILLSVTLIFCVLGLVFFSLGYDRTPTRPSFPYGGILVFVNEPHQSVDVNFITDTRGMFLVSVSSNRGGSFLVVASGSAAVEPIQDPNYTGHPDFRRGIHINSIEVGHFCRAAAYGQTGRFVCSSHTSYFIKGYSGGQGATAAVGYQHPYNRRIPIHIEVFGKLRNPIVSSSSSGSVELGQLPLIGAATSLAVSGRIPGSAPIDGPITIAGQISSPNGPSDIPRGTKWYAPDARVSISLTSSLAAISNPYSTNTPAPLLPPGYKLDSAAPSTVNSNELLWRATGNVQATWDLTNLFAAGHASVWLFVSGILFGAAAGFLGVAIDRSLGSH